MRTFLEIRDEFVMLEMQFKSRCLELAKEYIMAMDIKPGDHIMTHGSEKIISHIGPNIDKPYRPFVYASKIKKNGEPYLSFAEIWEYEKIETSEADK